MDYDILETIGDTLIQHGKLNDRVYIMHLHRGDMPLVLDAIENLAKTNKYSKIFGKVPANAAKPFTDRGYVCEATIPAMFKGSIDGLFFAKYLVDSRSCDSRQKEIEEIIELAQTKAPRANSEPHKRQVTMRSADESDVDAIAHVYKHVFESYPFPIHDPQYLIKTMHNNISYYVIEEQNEIVAVSSAEKYEDVRNVEMTDFATLPVCRGRGCASALLECMEEEMRAEGFLMAYTIARAMSHGMNITFAKAGYTYAGTLVNNTNIAGTIESMNVWYKSIA